MHDKFEKKKYCENSDVYKENFETMIINPPTCCPREVQEMRKECYKMRAHVGRSVFLAQEKQEKSSVPMLRMEAQPLKEALPEGGSIIVLFLPC